MHIAKKSFFIGMIISALLPIFAGMPSSIELTAQVAREMDQSIRPGGVDNRPFWNHNSINFMYPPAFNFAPVKGTVRYRFTVVDDILKEHVFEDVRPTADLSPVWASVPVGFVRVTVEGLDSAGRSLGMSGSRRFWRKAPYEPGKYPQRPWSCQEGAKRYFATLMAHKNTQHFLRHGTPDGKTVLMNVYPAKMNSALIRGMVRYAGLDASHRDDAMTVARRAADYMISISQPSAAPLAHFPPTYWKMENQTSNFASIRYAGQNMLVYPAFMGLAYLELEAVTGDARYLNAALGIARTYARLQLPNGTWHLKLWEKDASPVIEGDGDKPVSLIPIDVCMFMDSLAERTGDVTWRRLSDRAFAYIDNRSLTTWDWPAQFEDTEPSAGYRDHTSAVPISVARYLLKRFPGDSERRALARDLLRWVEDQFVHWRKPFRADGFGIFSETRSGYHPVWWSPKNAPADVLLSDQWIDVPGVAEKYRWTIMIDGLVGSMACAWMKLGELENDQLCLAKAKTLGDSILRVQQMNGDGSIPTHWRTKDLTGVSCGDNWTNCGVAAAIALCNLAGEKE